MEEVSKEPWSDVERYLDCNGPCPREVKRFNITCQLKIIKLSECGEEQ